MDYYIIIIIEITAEPGFFVNRGQ